MSRTTTYMVYKTKAVGITDYHNSWLSAPPLWEHICFEYLGIHRKTKCGNGPPIDTYVIGQLADGDHPLWKCFKNERIPEHLRLVLAWTCDWVIVGPDHLILMAEACEATAKTLAIEDKYPRTHWVSIAAELRTIKLKPRALGVGLSCTSVSDLWAVYNKNSPQVVDCLEIVK